MEEKKVQTVRPHSELLYDAFKTCPLGIAIENLEGQPLFVNPALCTMLGLNEEEMLGKHCVEFSPPEDAAKDWALFEQLRAGSIDHYQIDKRFFRRDGSTVWGRLSISLLKGADPPMVVAMVEDITEKKKAEEALLRYAAIVESSDDAIVGEDTNGTITNWNKGAERLFGYSASEAIGQNILFLSQADARDDGKGARIKNVWQGEVVTHHETVRRRKDGTNVDISLTVSPIVDVEGQVVGSSGIACDITERKRAQERLLEYEQVVEVLGDRIIVVDREYRYVIANAAFLNYRGFEKEQVIGHTVAEIVGKESFEADIKERFDECFQGKVVRHEVKYRYPKLGERNISVTYFPIRGPLGIDRIGCVLRDITEGKRAEETLRESEEKFRSVFRDAGVGMVIVATEGRFLAANKAFCDSLGYTEEELQEKTVESVTLPEDWPAFSKKLQEALTEGQGFQWFEKRCLHKSGRIVYTASSTSVIRSSNGEPQYFVGQVLDVTRRKEAEQTLADMTRKLVEAQEKERTRIARELHDDINQRLAMLAVELEQLQNDPSEIQQRVSELRKQATEISNDVQALSHELHSSKLEYLGAVGGMKSWCKEFGERQGLQIEFNSSNAQISLPREIGLCLFRVLQESLHNTAKHSGAKRIEVQLHEESDQIHLAIRDLGKGFDVEAAKKGRGLGLTSMQERLRLVNGEIAIESKPMGGTTIHVRVPFGSEKFSEQAAG
jgi:PAS domain S-box-containing protein